MIEAVGTSSVQGASPRSSPQVAASLPPPGGGLVSSFSVMPKMGTRLYVRVDGAAQRAILEARSSETGEVVNQYPSEAQLKAFKRAEKLQTDRAAQQQAVRAAQTQQREQTRPAPEAAPAQTAPAASVPSFRPASNVNAAAAIAVSTPSPAPAPAPVQQGMQAYQAAAATVSTGTSTASVLA